jgi:hypothetical protein
MRNPARTTFRDGMRSMALLACVASGIFVTSARAELGVAVSKEADHRLMLSRLPASVEAELEGLTGDDVPMFNVVRCDTLGSRLIGQARASELNMDVIVARYNLVNMWSGNLCGGKTDVMPTGEEAKSWLDELAGLSRQEDGAPFIDARRRLAEVLIFGAPGVEPDLPRAQAYIAGESKRDPEMLLFAAYMAGRGLGGTADPARYVSLIREAADRGNVDASALLAQALELGEGVKRDERAAVARYEEISRYVMPPIWFRLGLMLKDGRGVKADPCRARDFLTLAAEHNSASVPAARAYLEEISAGRSCPKP